MKIIDLTYIINFCYNEMSQQKKDNILKESKLIREINKVKEGFNFRKVIKNKIIKIFGKLSNIQFYDDVKENLTLFFNNINLFQ